MSNNFSKFPKIDLNHAKPGEIWEVSRSIKNPLKVSLQPPYSEAAQQFIQGESPPRYVMMVNTSEPLLENEWQEITVMVLSSETAFVSQVDIIIPAHISGLEHDVLAETWHILPMLNCNLRHSLNTRLSRATYDCLINIGDVYYGLTDAAEALETVGLITSSRPPSQTFHQQEQTWSEILSFPVADYRTYAEALMQADIVIEAALKVERTLQRLTVTPIIAPTISLQGWFEQQMDAGWLTFTEVMDLGWSSWQNVPIQGARSPEDRTESPIEVADLIDQLWQESDEAQRRTMIRQLGDIGQNNAAGIGALMAVLRTTTDDETLWAAVESLWRVDPGNPAEGVRRVKLIDLGMQVNHRTVALAIAIVQKNNQQIGVMLRVYPTGDHPYLPEHLKLVLIENPNRTYEVVARRTDLYVQLKFSAQVGETFSVRVALGETGITESFVI